jgi:hypothetical protein
LIYFYNWKYSILVPRPKIFSIQSHSNKWIEAMLIRKKGCHMIKNHLTFSGQSLFYLAGISQSIITVKMLKFYCGNDSNNTKQLTFELFSRCFFYFFYFMSLNICQPLDSSPIYSTLWACYRLCRSSLLLAHEQRYLKIKVTSHL